MRKLIAIIFLSILLPACTGSYEEDNGLYIDCQYEKDNEACQ